MASNTIKGLTVEIGGDTTKLGKALENVNQKSTDLSRELGQINRMLKLDPGNAELLAQKQKVLAEAVANTSDKLKTLQAAEKQVQKQFQRGEVSEAQVRELQREVIATTNKLQGYENAARETAQAVNGLGSATQDVKQDTLKVEKGADQASDALDDLADSADKAERSSSNMGSKLGGVAVKGLAAVAAAATAAVGALVGSAEASRDYRTEMGKLDAAFSSSGHSAKTATDTYKTLKGVIGETDQAVEAAQQIALLAESEKDAAAWADLGAGVFGKFGDALQPETFFEAANETIKLGESTGAYTQMLEGCGISVEEFNAGLAECSTEAEKQKYMLDVTEKALGSAGEAYKKNNAEVIRANEANEEWAASMAEVGASMEPILSDIKIMGAALLSDLLPSIKQVTEAFRGILQGDAGAAKGLGTALSGILTTLVEKVVGLLPTLVEVGVSLVTTLTTTIISMVPMLVETGLQIVTALITGLTQAFPQIIQALADMIPQLVDVLVAGVPLLIDGALQMLLAICDAVDLLLPPLIEALPRIIMCIVDVVMAAIPVLLDAALQLLLAIVDAIPLLIGALVPLIPDIVTTIVLGLLDCVPVLLDAAVELLLAIVRAIPQVIVELIKALPKIGKTMLDYYKQLPGKLWAVLKSIVTNIVKLGVESVKAIAKGAYDVVTTAVSIFKGLPGKIWTWLKSTVSKVTSWGSEMVSKARSAVKKMVTAVVDTVKSLPSKMREMGKNLVQGLWSGLNNSYTWLKNKIKGWVGNVTKFLKKLFGINSPSRVTAYMGEMLDEGLAKGIEDNTSAPLDAMGRLSKDLLAEGPDGLTLTRQINHSFGVGEAAAFSGADMLGKLDQILQAIQAGQVIALDGKALIGSTAAGYDSTLGQRRVLAARGAI